jgi:hypothetical protein
MAGPFFVDDSGSNTAPRDTWAKACTSIQQLDTAVTFASNERVYFGADMVGTDAGAALTIIGPTADMPVEFVSSTVGSGATVEYAKSATAQINATGASSDVAFDGSFHLEGIKVVAGRDVLPNCDSNEHISSYDCTFALGAAGSLRNPSNNNGRAIFRKLVLDLSADGTTDRSPAPFIGSQSVGLTEFHGLTFVNPAYRTGVIIDGSTGGAVICTGADFSGFTNATECELVSGSSLGAIHLHQCKTKESFVAVSSGTPGPRTDILLTNCGPADDPSYLYHYTYAGSAMSSTAVTRTGGASIESISCSWLVTTTANCSEVQPYRSPWLYGEVAAGARTFDVFITNDTLDVTDAEVWLVVEYLGTLDDALLATATDQRATITTEAADQTDDTTSTWNGAGPAFTYKQRLRVSATVGEAGQYRARVVVGKASISAAANFYIDPIVVVN